VLLAPPRKAKAYLASVSSRAKTDRVDGRGIALFAVSRTAANPLPAYPLKSEAVAQLDQLLSARKGLVQALMSLKQRLPELPHARPHLEATVADLQARLQELDAEIARHTRDKSTYPALAELRKVPGIGPVTAAAVLARLTGRDFPRADHFVAFIGLDVAVFQSGKRQGERGLTKQGDAYLRRLFYLAAIAHVKSRESPYRALFARLLAQGHARVAAYNAVARKLARLCWSLVKHGSTYEPERVHTPANPPKPAATEPAPITAPEAELPAAAVTNSPPVPPRRVRLGSSQRANPAVSSPGRRTLDLT
jgi:transposase